MTSDLENDRLWRQFLAPSQIKTGSPPTGLPAIEAPRKTSRLCWVARMFYLLPWIGITLSILTPILLKENSFPYVYPFNYIFTAVYFILWFVAPGFLLATVTAIALRRHLLGGMLLVVSSGAGAFSLYMAARLLGFPKSGTVGLVVPFCVVFLVGIILHLVVWWKEGRHETTLRPI